MVLGKLDPQIFPAHGENESVVSAGELSGRADVGRTYSYREICEISYSDLSPRRRLQDFPYS